MYKLIDSASFFREDEPIVTLIDLKKYTSGLEKLAADSSITAYVAELKPEEGYFYVHILALGASEFYGANRNGDSFPEDSLIKYHHTFVTSPGFIFRNHINKDPSIAIGKVVFSTFNVRMHRVEIIAAIDRVKGKDILERVEAGDFPSTSMACKTSYDECSICNNRAHTRAEYCTHLRNELGKIYPDGRKVTAINSAPLKFMEQSIVVRPADATSSILMKVASDSSFTQVQSSAELAEIEGLGDNVMDKQADLSKLADLIKEIDGGLVVDADPELDKLLAKTKDPKFALIPILKNFKLNDVLYSLGHLGISPSLAFLAELIAVKLVGDHMTGSGATIASLAHQVDPSKIAVPKEMSDEVNGPQSSILKLFAPELLGSSMLPEFVEKRAFLFDDGRERDDFEGKHYNTNIGYIGNGPEIEKTPFEMWQAANGGMKENGGIGKVLTTLLAVGGAALAAKWFITRTIEQKMREALPHPGNGVKIVLVKSASDYKLTHRLAKAAMIKCLKKV
jgi:hypothetical protein